MAARAAAKLQNTELLGLTLPAGPGNEYSWQMVHWMHFLLLLQACGVTCRLTLLGDPVGGIWMLVTTGIGIYAWLNEMDVAFVSLWGILSFLNCVFHVNAAHRLENHGHHLLPGFDPLGRLFDSRDPEAAISNATSKVAHAASGAAAASQEAVTGILHAKGHTMPGGGGEAAASQAAAASAPTLAGHAAASGSGAAAPASGAPPSSMPFKIPSPRMSQDVLLDERRQAFPESPPRSFRWRMT